MTRRAVLRAAPALLAAGGGRVRAEPQTHVVVIAGMKFGVPTEVLHAGDTVSFWNHDMFRHTATARDGSFDLDLPPGGEERITLEKAGKIDVFCKFHPGMMAKLEVTP